VPRHPTETGCKGAPTSRTSVADAFGVGLGRWSSRWQRVNANASSLSLPNDGSDIAKSDRSPDSTAELRNIVIVFFFSFSPYEPCWLLSGVSRCDGLDHVTVTVTFSRGTARTSAGSWHRRLKVPAASYGRSCSYGSNPLIACICATQVVVRAPVQHGMLCTRCLDLIERCLDLRPPAQQPLQSCSDKSLTDSKRYTLYGMPSKQTTAPKNLEHLRVMGFDHRSPVGWHNT
jgi:hypothetical protein